MFSKDRIIILLTLFLLFIFLFSFHQFSDITCALNIKDGSELDWNIEVIDEIIKIDADGNAEITTVIIFTFLKQNSSDIDYEIEIELGENAELQSIHPNVDENFEYAKFLNYSTSTIKGKQILYLTFNRNISSIYHRYYVSFQYNIDRFSILNSQFYENTKNWRLNYPISHYHIFDPQFRIYFILPKNSVITYNNFNLSYPLEIKEPRFRRINAFPWDSNQSTYESISLDVDTLNTNDYTVILFEEETFYEKKLTINYDTSNNFMEGFGFFGLIAGIAGSFVGMIGVIISIKTLKEKRTREVITKMEKTVQYKDKVIVKRISSSIDKIAKLDSLLLVIPSVLGISGFFIELFLNSQIQSTYLPKEIQSEILYYTTLPFLFFAIFMPLYIGYWRGAITQDLIIERIRGWIYLIEGGMVYISSIILFFIFITLAIVHSQLMIFLGIFVIISQIFVSFGLRSIIVPFTNSYYKSFGRKRKTKKDKIILGRTYLSSISFSFFFWSLAGSLVMYSIFKKSNPDLFVYAFFPLGFGVFTLYYSLKSEQITSELVENKRILKSIDKEQIKKSTVWFVLSFIIVAIFYTAYYGISKHIFINLCLYVSLGIVIYNFLKLLEVKFENRILK